MTVADNNHLHSLFKIICSKFCKSCNCLQSKRICRHRAWHGSDNEMKYKCVYAGVYVSVLALMHTAASPFICLALTLFHCCIISLPRLNILSNLPEIIGLLSGKCTVGSTMLSNFKDRCLMLILVCF
jgi:hypothetical protein